MRTTMRNFTRVDWLRTRFASGAILLFGFIPLSGFALVQTSGPDNVSHVRTASAAPHPVASKLHRSVWRKRDLQDLICESSFFFEIRQNEVKKALLTLEVQASRSINTDEARVKGNICIDSLATRLLRRSPKVDTVVRDERPIAIENCGFQLPILLPSKTEMIDVRAHESLVSSQPDQTRAEIFIDQQFLHA